MAVITQAQGTRSSGLLSLASLATGTYAATAAIDLGASIPLDVTFEVECLPSASTSGNKQLVLFAKLSLDNSNFGSGPESGTTTTNEPDLHWVGTLPCNDNTTHRRFFNLAGLPITRYLKLVIKNDTGVTLTSGNIYRADITGAA
jgi:hypothetical protein